MWGFVLLPKGFHGLSDSKASKKYKFFSNGYNSIDKKEEPHF